jgi:flagellar biosynthetic protein FliQ
MTDTTVVHLVAQALLLIGKLAIPVLVSTLAVGLAVSLLQAVTSIQESTLSFLPKLVTVALVLLVSGHWMLGQLTNFTYDLFRQIPQLVGGG